MWCKDSGIIWNYKEFSGKLLELAIIAKNPAAFLGEAGMQKQYKLIKKNKFGVNRRVRGGRTRHRDRCPQGLRLG